MKKLRIAMIVNAMPINGISTVIMNFCRALDKSKYEITIFAGNPISEVYMTELNEMGIIVIKTPSKHKSIGIMYYSFLLKNLNKNNFDIVHIHGNSSTMTIELFISLIKGIKKRIAHCHSTGTNHKIIHRILKPLANLFATNKIACSKESGQWVFYKNSFIVIENGFCVDKFKFSEKFRTEIRKKLGISNNAFLIGHIGRFNGTKNQEYLLKLFERINAETINSYLLFVGSGPDYDDFIKLVNKNKSKDRIVMYGESNTPEKIYSAIDLFLFPSKYEGFGLVAIEAQLSGLYCIASENVPNAVNITGNITFLPTSEKNIDKWVNEIINNKSFNRKQIDFNSPLIKKYDIKNSIGKLEKIYNK